MKILLLGHMQHGKSLMGKMLFEEYGITNKDSSIACAEIFLYDFLKEKYNYRSFKECYEDRKKHRDEWYKLICEYNSPDKAKLAKEILKRASMYVGMRSNDELQECLKQNLFDLILGIYRPKFPNEPITSFNINIWKECDLIIPNDGTILDLKNKLKKLNRLFNGK